MFKIFYSQETLTLKQHTKFKVSTQFYDENVQYLNQKALKII